VIGRLIEESIMQVIRSKGLRGNERRKRDAIILILISAHCRSNCFGRASLAESCVEWAV